MVPPHFPQVLFISPLGCGEQRLGTFLDGCNEHGLLPAEGAAIGSGADIRSGADLIVSNAP
jgi:hypothetical protein